MSVTVTDVAVFAAVSDGQGPLQVAELLLAFVLSSVIGLERQFRGKSAGLRTQTIVGTSSALIVLVSKYGFSDVLDSDSVSFDPSRVAAQIVTGIGFLGAGLIITRRGAVRGLTTAASVWETAAIGMAAGAGLPVLALAVTGLHFLTVFGYTPLGQVISHRGQGERDLTLAYEDRRGVLRKVLTLCSERHWELRSMSVLGIRGRHDLEGEGAVRLDQDLVVVRLTLFGRAVDDAVAALGGVPGVIRVDRGEHEDD